MIIRRPSALAAFAVALLLVPVCMVTLGAQRGGGGQGGGRGGRGGRGAAANAKEASPIDLLGQWVSVVTEDYRFRMVTPPKGDYSAVPLTPEGIKVADSWNLAADRQAVAQCKAFGAAALLRLPMRIRISWQDDNTLKLETDSGTQTRLFRFAPSKPAAEATFTDPSANIVASTALPPAAPPTLQGTSVASWETPRPGGGSLKVVTTNLLPGYLRKNGVPYSANAVVTEYLDRHTSFGTEWITVTSIVEDPQYLTQPFVTSSSFKRETSTDKWRPSGCDYE
jgi:hypothetical protein